MKNNLLLSGLTFLLVLVACTPATPTPSDIPATPGISVGITQAACPSVIINAGDQVVWTNQDQNRHVVRVMSSNRAQLADSGVLQRGDSFALNFPQSGTYPYTCSEDGKMRGTVTVRPQSEE